MGTICNSSKLGCCYTTPSTVGAATPLTKRITGLPTGREREMDEVTSPIRDMEANLPFPSLSEATRTWLRVALLSFGGPAGQISVMHRIIVEEKRWISEQRFLHAL